MEITEQLPIILEVDNKKRIENYFLPVQDSDSPLLIAKQ